MGLPGTFVKVSCPFEDLCVGLHSALGLFWYMSMKTLPFEKDESLSRIFLKVSDVFHDLHECLHSALGPYFGRYDGEGPCPS